MGYKEPERSAQSTPLLASVFAREKQGQDAVDVGVVQRIISAVAKALVVKVDLEPDDFATDLDRCHKMIAVGISVLGEVREARNGKLGKGDKLRPLGGDPLGADHAALIDGMAAGNHRCAKGVIRLGDLMRLNLKVDDARRAASGAIVRDGMVDFLDIAAGGALVICHYGPPLW